MSCLQVTAFRPSLKIPNQYKTVRGPSIQCIVPTKKCMKILNHYVRQSTAVSRYQQCAPVCLFGGKGKSDNGNEASPWKSLEKAMGGLKKEQSLEDVLRKQMEKQDYFDDKGGGGTPPTGGGGGGGGGSGSSGFGGPEDEGSEILDEIIQVTLATLGIIFLYAYILNGNEITTFIKDVFKFLIGGGKSLRIKRILYEWGAFYERLKRKDEYDPYWLEKEILCTTTWYDSPQKYINMFESSMDEDDDSDDEDDNTEAYNENAYDEITNEDDNDNNDDKVDKENTYSDNIDDDNNGGDNDISYNDNIDDDDDF